MFNKMICFVCKNAFFKIEILVEHLKKKHHLKTHSTYRCIEKSCYQAFHNLGSYKRHAVRKHLIKSAEIQRINESAEIKRNNISEAEANNIMLSPDINVIKESKIEKLKDVLKSWDLSDLSNTLIEKEIFVDVLKVIKVSHIPLYLSSIPDGKKIMFEARLEQWRESIGCPLLNDRLSHLCSHPPSAPVRFQSTSSRSSPYPVPNNDLHLEKSEQNISLSTILNNTLKGKLLIEYYNSEQQFKDEQRTMLINTIATYFEENQTPLNLRVSHNIEKQIIQRFPTEALEYYRTTKTGRIYNKYSNLKRALRSVCSKPAPAESVNSSVEKETFESNAEDTEVDTIKFENLSED